MLAEMIRKRHDTRGIVINPEVDYIEWMMRQLRDMNLNWNTGKWLYVSGTCRSRTVGRESGQQAIEVRTY